MVFQCEHGRWMKTSDENIIEINQTSLRGCVVSLDLPQGENGECVLKKQDQLSRTWQYHILHAY